MNSAPKKQKPSQKDKNYKIKTDLNYLRSYNYKITKQIGRGSSGIVYKAANISNPQNQYAIKIPFNQVSREQTYVEMAFLQLVKNKHNLPKLVNLLPHQKITHIVTEYFKFQPFIKCFHTFQIQDVKHYIYELLVGLKNLKDLGIFHRNIKPDNFLYNPETKRGIIIDFGMAQIDSNYPQKLIQKIKDMEDNKKGTQQIQETLKIYKRLIEVLKIIGRDKIGAQNYMPLETILHCKQQSYQTDIWSVGVILLQFVARKYNIFNNVTMINIPNSRKGKPIKNYFYVNYIIELANFFGDKVVKQCQEFGYQLKLPRDIDQVSFKNIAIINGYDDTLQDLLYSLLQLNPGKRITVENALSHAFFDSIREEHQRKFQKKYNI